jgi:two-component system, chemotaxis family, sensor kinase CheA
MDDLLRDFVIETAENIDVVDNELVRFERDPNNTAIIAQIFRLVHTIKGTCGFLGLPRLEALTHAAETVIDRFREGAPVTRTAVTLILQTIDRIKVIMAELDRAMAEPPGDDRDLIAALEALPPTEAEPTASLEAVPVKSAALSDTPSTATDITVGTLVYQVLERELRPGEVALDELEKAFRDTEVDEAEFAYGTLARAGLAQDRRAAPRRDAEDQRATSRPDADEQGSQEGGLRQSSIRVPVETLEHLMTMVSELVLTRNQLLEIARRDEASPFKAPLQRLSHVTAELQESVMKTRMQPIGNAWAKLPRLVRDLCEDLGKDIDLQMSGAETEIDRQLLELIKDPILHMVRNAADHGIEGTAERVRAGKPLKGRLRIAAAQEGGYITLTIADDGRGLDLDRIRRKAVTLGLLTEGDALRISDQQAAKFIFHPGFSTAEKLTNVSGRGVGMDVVRNNIEQMGGAIDVRTAAGQGTTIVIKIPLTLAIAAALIVESAGQRFALPQMAVIELVRPNAGEARIEHIHAAPVLRLRERLLPLVDLAQALRIGAAAPTAWDEVFIVVCQVGSLAFGIVVDSVLQTEEIVVKPVSARIRHIPCYSGATILGDGAVIMILDPNGLARNVGAVTEAHNDNAAGAKVAATAAQTLSLLVFKAGDGGPKAVPLAMVTRLEEIPIERIETTGAGLVVQYRGRLMRLVRTGADIALRTEGAQPVLVFGSAESPVGLLVDEIVDIAEEAIEIGGAQRPGVLGTAVVRERATDIVDVAHFVPELGGQAARAKPRLLLVQPAELLRAMLAPVLQAAGFAVRTAASLAEAEQALADGGFQVVVADVEDAQAFRLSEIAGVQASFIGLAGRATGALLEEARRSGFDDVVGTFDREGLLASVGALGATLGEAA